MNVTGAIESAYQDTKADNYVESLDALFSYFDTDRDGLLQPEDANRLLLLVSPTRKMNFTFQYSHISFDM